MKSFVYSQVFTGHSLGFTEVCEERLTVVQDEVEENYCLFVHELTFLWT